MTTQIRLLTALAAVLLGAGLLAACGGDSADEDTDPQEILDRTFSGENKLESGVVEVSLSAAAPGDEGGSISASLSGPFEAPEEEGQLPSFAFGATATGEGQGSNLDFEGGLTVLPDGAWVGFGGEEYEVDPATFEQFSQMYSEAAAQQPEGEDGSAIFEQLGIDPRGWLTNVTNEGTEDLDGDEVVHVSGDADVAQIVQDSQALSEQAGQLSEQLDPETVQELENIVSEARIDVYSGTDDDILRRLTLTLELQDIEGGDTPESATVEFVLGFSEVNEDQEITAPEDARPLSELPGLGDLGGLGGLGGAGDLPGGGAGGGGTGGGGGAGAGDSSEAYLECLEEAGASPEEIQACADLL